MKWISGNRALNILALCLVLMTTSSCLKDKGNYNYEEINRVVISGINPIYVVDYGKRLVIKPVLSFTHDAQEDTSNYTYRWISDNRIGYVSTAAITLSASYNMDTTITLAYGNYRAYYRVTDKRTGVFTDSYFTLTVSAPTYEGWVLMCDKEDGSSRLDMISRKGNIDTVYRDVLAAVNSGFKTTGKPGFVTYANTLMTPSNGSGIIFIGTSEKMAGLGRDSFDYQPSYDLNNNIPVDYRINDFTSSRLYLKTYAGMLWAENKLLTVGLSSIGGPMNTQDGGTTLFKPSPFIALHPSMTGVSVVFNEDNKTFLRALYNGRTCLSMKAGTLFDFTTTMDLVWMSYTIYNGNEIFAILNDKTTGKFFLARFTDAGDQRYFAEITATDIAHATNFVVSPNLGYIFYNVEGKIYEYDFSLRKSFLMHDYGSTKISMMKFHSFTSLTGAINGTFYTGLSRSLIVCTYEAGNVENSGSLDLYTVPEINGPIKLSKSYKGTGKIVSLTYRER